MINIIEVEYIKYSSRIKYLDKIIIIWESNIIYHFLSWLFLFPFIILISISTRYYFHGEITQLDVNHLAEMVFTERVIPLILFISILAITLSHSKILRIQIDLESDSVVWENMSMLNTFVVHRKLSDLQAIEQPHQSILFPAPAKLIFADGWIPLEIRNPWRRRKYDMAQKLADTLKVPILI